MSTSRPLPAYNYEDYVPIEGISCPICGNACGSLLDLNKHLDVAHNEEDTKGAFLSWFSTAQKKVQNTLSVGTGNRYLGTSPNANAVERLGNNNPAFFVSDNERQGTEFITKEYWQRETNNDMCSLPGCGKTLGRNGAGKQHCVKGHERPTSLLTSPASSLRSINLERSESSSSKESFGSMIAPNSPLVSSGNSILSMKLKYRDGEQTVAKWQDDRTVTKCPLCLKEKGSQKSQQTHESYQVAAQIRKSLLDNFALYDTLSKSIRSLPAPTAPMKRLQTNICTAANLYLQRNMLPLQMLPRLLKPEKKAQSPSGKPTSNGSPDPTATWKQDIRMQIQAYKEQYGLVEGFIRDAQKERRIDDTKTLKTSLDELRVEIDRLQAQLTS
ncbi:hypothetical protein CLU79DRAFT_803527 [Phycomyces nitens]|nr:hypothetical protein CLU79DRAFT_803527 [Phycomyces nitens]